MQLNGQAAIVTGGASGLGGATAAFLAQAGAKVTIFDMNVELGEEKATAIGGKFLRVDVTDESAVEAAIAEAEGLHGKARILVNCAGIGPPAKVVDRDGAALPLASFTIVVNVNLLGSFNVLSKFAAALHKAEPVGEERGVIVNTASVAAFDGQIGQAAYAASKGGIVGMTLPVARELARRVVVLTAAPAGDFAQCGVFDDPQAVRDLAGKAAVVGDDDDGAGVGVDGGFERRERLHVEVVGRLVEQQQVRT